MSLAKDSIYDGSPSIGSRMAQTIQSLATAFVLHETFEEFKVAGAFWITNLCSAQSTTFP
jgi:hypothetical protein